MTHPFDSNKLFYGMNIHPQYSSAPWFKTPAEVIDELYELGCTVARIDCYGLEDDANIVLEHVKEAEKKGILVVPCFGYHSPFESNNFEAGIYCGKLTAEILSDYCPIYEVSNEMSVYCNGIGPGTDPTRYDQDKYVNCRELIRGVIEGIKSVQPNAKIIIGGGVTTLTGFNKMLWNGTEPNGSSGHPLVRWDYTGWHWYESSGRIDDAYDGTDTPYNVLEELSKFGVPIWITELGFIPDNTNFDRQSTYVNAALVEYREYRDVYNVINTCWYALYDDGSGDFGLIHVDASRSAAASANTDTKAYAEQKSKLAEVAYAKSKSRRTSAAVAASPRKTSAATTAEPDSLTRKPAHETFKLFVSTNPDDDQPGEDFHTAEYTLPIALYQRLRDAAAQNHISENDELIYRLDSTFKPLWTLYENLARAAEQNGVSLSDEIVTRLESTFAARK
ncbi:hypothetical protein [Burkholderia pyrrocinia]|uniref:hypothetical protein n=1 Tax=Burkholderia pyrrocinia TaxID=60550 RepID=UPI00158CEBA8|nr:hypothetical protein [Burkholderia pyrrocinia]